MRTSASVNGRAAKMSTAASAGAPPTEDRPLVVLTVRDVAERFRVPISWVYERTRGRGADRIPHRKMGKYLRFIDTEVEEWFRNLPGSDLKNAAPNATVPSTQNHLSEPFQRRKNGSH